MKADLIGLVVKRFGKLNQEITDDSLLGENYQVGHSFFCPKGVDFSGLDRDWYDGIVETEIIPLLKEYWFDDPKRAEKARKELLGTMSQLLSEDEAPSVPVTSTGIPIRNLWYMLLYAWNEPRVIYRWKAEVDTSSDTRCIAGRYPREISAATNAYRAGTVLYQGARNHPWNSWSY